MGVSKKPGEMVFDRAEGETRALETGVKRKKLVHRKTHRTFASHVRGTCRSGEHQLLKRCKRTERGRESQIGYRIDDKRIRGSLDRGEC